MEENNYRTDFELFLRESIEDFKMIPARKIWHSLYNDMHPDRKWPSITVCALILFCILYVGISNNNSINKATLATKNQIAYSSYNNVAVYKKEITENKDFDFEKRIANKLTENNQQNTRQTVPYNTDNPSNKITTTVANNIASQSSFASNNKYFETVLSSESNSLLCKVVANKNRNVEIKRASNTQNNLPTSIINNVVVETETESSSKLNKSFGIVVKKITTFNMLENEMAFPPIHAKNSNNNNIESSIEISKIVGLNNDNESINAINRVQQASLKEDNLQIAEKQKKTASAEPETATELLKKTTAYVNDDNKENSASCNQKTITKQEYKSTSPFAQVSKAQARKSAVAKFKEKSIINYYVTPSFGFRTLHSKQDATKLYSTNSSPFLQANNSAVQNHKDVAALNFEAGFTVAHKMNKKVFLKTGIQANYTNYVSKVTDIGHSTQTNFRSANQQLDNFRSSHYSTYEGDANLNRSNIQVAIPIGIDLKLLGNNKINWFVGATIQPTYIISDNAYVFSGDEKYYIFEKSLQRKFNINTALETYLSIKTRKGVTLNIGPQLRYQLLNSYKKDYNYSEKLYNIGIKIGVSTTL